MGISGELYNLENYLSGRSQRVILSWKPVLTGVPQGSILGPLLFLVYVYEFSNELRSNVKLFADDASLFILWDKNESANVLNNDQFLMSKMAYNWKMKKRKFKFIRP